MNSKIKPTTVLFITSIVSAVVFAAVRIILTMTVFDVRYGVYVHENIIPNIFHIILLADVISLAVFAYMKAPKREADYFIKKNDAAIFFSCLCAFMLGANTLLSLIDIAKNGTAPLFDILEICFAIPSLVFFFGLVKKNDSPSKVMMFASLFPIAWSSICLIRVYFDNSVLHTSPTKTFTELAFLCAMLYFLTEARMQLGIVSHQMFLAISLISPIFLITHAVPSLLLTDKLLIAHSDNFLHSFIALAFAMFIYSRLFSYLYNKGTPDCQTGAKSDS